MAGAQFPVTDDRYTKKLVPASNGTGGRSVLLTQGLEWRLSGAGASLGQYVQLSRMIQNTARGAGNAGKFQAFDRRVLQVLWIG
jgi:hypothetical protein